MSVVVKVTRKYQVTIPEEIRSHLNLQVGDKVLAEYDPVEEVVRIVPLHKGKRSTLVLNRSLDVEDIEEALGKGALECLRSRL